MSAAWRERENFYIGILQEKEIKATEEKMSPGVEITAKRKRMKVGGLTVLLSFLFFFSYARGGKGTIWLQSVPACLRVVLLWPMHFARVPPPSE